MELSLHLLLVGIIVGLGVGQVGGVEIAVFEEVGSGLGM